MARAAQTVFSDPTCTASGPAPTSRAVAIVTTGRSCFLTPRLEHKPLAAATTAEPERTPAVPIQRSVTRNYVVCLECGWRGKTLGRHLQARHGLSVNEYQARWKLPREHRLTAPAYLERRSTMARQFGLGQQGRGRRPTGKAPAPARRRRTGTSPNPARVRRRARG